jgi:hypothetical protein
MLVHAREPFGQVKLGSQKFYGAATNCQSVDVPYEFYKEFEDYLIPATYRENFLRKHFRGPFPIIAFKLTELRHLPRETLKILAHGMTIHVDDEVSNNGLIKGIQAKLRPCLDH